MNSHECNSRVARLYLQELRTQPAHIYFLAYKLPPTNGGKEETYTEYGRASVSLAGVYGTDSTVGHFSPLSFGNTKCTTMGTDFLSGGLIYSTRGMRKGLTRTWQASPSRVKHPCLG